MPMPAPSGCRACPPAARAASPPVRPRLLGFNTNRGRKARQHFCPEEAPPRRTAKGRGSPQRTQSRSSANLEFSSHRRFSTKGVHPKGTVRSQRRATPPLVGSEGGSVVITFREDHKAKERAAMGRRLSRAFPARRGVGNVATSNLFARQDPTGNRRRKRLYLNFLSNMLNGVASSEPPVTC